MPRPTKSSGAEPAPAGRASAKRSPAKATPAKATPGKKSPAKVTPAKKATPAKTAPAKKAAAAKKAAPAKKPAPAKKSPPAKKAVAAKTAPAKKAPSAKKPAPGKKTAPAKKPAPGKTAPAKKSPAKKPAARRRTSPYDARFNEAQRLHLLEERRRLVHDEAVLTAEADELAQMREPGDVQFDEESGEGDTLAVERERDLALAASFRNQVEEIDHALAKITAGTYGVCEVSGQPIPKERLRAIPWARERVEYKVGGFGRR